MKTIQAYEIPPSTTTIVDEGDCDASYHYFPSETLKHSKML